MSVFVPEAQEKARLFAKMVGREVIKYFRDPENRKRFEEWHREKYGTEYVWERG